jgi:hypothetical protein
VYSHDFIYNDWPVNAGEFIAWLSEKIDSIPVEFRKDAKVEFGVTHGYEGDADPNIDISYTRPETDDEMNVRLSELLRREEVRQRTELKMLEELKAKYEK